MKNDKTTFFDSYSSKIKPLYIPIRKGTEDDDCFYVKRDKLHRKLKGWLEASKSGVYLIAGYRGMGKTCFLNNVLEDIGCDKIVYEAEDKFPFKCKSLWACFRGASIWALLNLVSYWGIVVFFMYNCCFWLLNSSLPLSGVFCFFCSIILYVCSSLIKTYRDDDHKYRMSIKLNLGPEVIKERDVLALVVNMLQKKYLEYKASMRYTHPVHKILWLLFISSLSFTLSYTLVMTLVIQIKFLMCEKTCYVHWLVVIYSYYTIILCILCVFFYPLVSWIVTKCTCMMAKYIRSFNSVPFVILREINLLSERINSVVSREQSATVELKKYVFGKKKGNTYPLADVREIEQELNTIFENISNGEKLMFKVPEFIIVFDELDKIDNFSSEEDKDKTELIPEYENVISGFPGGTTSRKRMQNVLNLLANMKYFINTTNAKFVFVSGREIYDSSLSDVSDREFAISSVFNGIIYLESFLSSHNNRREISSMTERYLCKRLMTDDMLKLIEENKKEEEEENKNKEETDEAKYSLKNYYLVLNLIYKKPSAYERLLIDKTMMQLYHFCIYLTHVSNGAPKKIISYFEKYVHYPASDVDMEKDLEIDLMKWHKRKSPKPTCYLAFSYRDQQKINFIHYMAYPVMQAIINASGNFGDKLLLSGVFLTDHIYKHHKDGFSWRNLELVPELLDANKTPELRSFINSIIDFLKQTHLSVMYSSVYTLKFPRRISEEISVFSKVSEEISAIFNFTSEETLSVKLYYAKLLKYYNRETVHDANPGKYNRTLANIHHILADLYLSEEDFTNAIFEYQSCSALIDGLEFTPSTMLFHIRNKLKLALAYEKRNTFDSAYFVYNELIIQLIKYRSFDEKEFKLTYDKKDDVISKEGIEYKLEKKDVLPLLIENDLEHMHDLIPKLALFEDVRFVYQPLLAKLLVTEKMEYCGVTRNKMAETEEEFKFLSRLVNQDERFFIIANFYREMGNIMYCKNGFLQFKMYYKRDVNNNHIKAWDLWEYDIENAIRLYCKELDDMTYYNDMVLFFKNIDETDLCNIVKNKWLKEGVECTVNKIFEGNIRKTEGAVWEYLKRIYDVYDLKKRIVGVANEYMVERNDADYNLTNNEKYESYKRDSRIIFEKIYVCHRRRRTCRFNNNYYPCYACKYLNKSLRILMKNVFEEENESDITKSIILWEQIVNMKTLPREDTLVLIAGILDAFGSVMLSCSYSYKNKDDSDKLVNDRISVGFLTNFFHAIERAQDVRINIEKQDEKICIKDFFDGCTTFGSDKEKESISFLEKGILYFWVASEYYSSSKSKEAFYCREKIINILLYYVKISQVNNDYFIEFLDKIEKYIVNDSIRYVYSGYEKINMVELQKIKWNFSKEGEPDEKGFLRHLSLFPDMEPLLSTYYELCIDLWKNRVKNRYHRDCLTKKISLLYRSPLLGSSRVEMTITGCISTLHLKASYNKMLCDLLLPENNKILSFDDVNKLFKSHGLNIFDEEHLASVGNNFTKNKLLLFLIKDSLFCLSRIIEKLAPIKDVTLFSQSYIADVYYDMLEWNKLYRKYYNDFVKDDELKKIVQEMENDNAMQSRVNYLDKTYAAEMAIHHYRIAQELHSEGKAYKNFIANLHVQDDDLNNNTFQFQHAVERYLINSGYISRKSQKLKKEFHGSERYNIDNFMNKEDIKN